MRSMYFVTPLFPNGLPFNLIIGIVNMLIFYGYMKNVRNNWISQIYFVIQSLSMVFIENYSENSFLNLQLVLLGNLLISHIVI